MWSLQDCRCNPHVFMSGSLRFCLQNELIERLESEGPKNHIDLRNRLDKSGKRHGKVIEYKFDALGFAKNFNSTNFCGIELVNCV